MSEPSITGRLHKSEPRLQSIWPLSTEEQRRKAEEIAQRVMAFLKEVGTDYIFMCGEYDK